MKNEDAQNPGPGAGPSPASDGEVVYEGVGHHSLMEIFETPSFREMVRLVLHGIKQPRDSGEYKYAMLQLQRLLAPVSAIVVPLLAVIIMVVSTAMGPPVVQYDIKVLQPEPVKEELEKVEEIIEQIDQPDPTEFSEVMDVNVPGNSDIPTPTTAATSEKFSAQVAELDAVQMVKSPVVMKGIYSSRTPGQRGTALASYGGSGSTEGAVLRALRWLKKNQETDGSWPQHKHAMTGLALLCFLAHGETPASEEFGGTVERGIKWLIANQGRDGGFPRRYEHAIATYALCEAYALTKIPTLEEPATKAVEILVRGQNPSGGFDYGLDRSNRDDTSVMGWCAQALKAAKMAGIHVSGLDEAMKKAVQGFKKNAHPSGGFGYTGPGQSGLTGVGVLCMQLLGAANDPDCVRGLAHLTDATFNWEGGGKYNQNYYWYYITQAKFHAGKDTWEAWNKVFSKTLVSHQTIIKNGIEDAHGKLVDIGFWDMDAKISGHTDGPVMNTALCCLQLEVYYRYLPTYKPPEDVTAEAPTLGSKKGDAEVDITF